MKDQFTDDFDYIQGCWPALLWYILNQLSKTERSKLGSISVTKIVETLYQTDDIDEIVELSKLEEKSLRL